MNYSVAFADAKTTDIRIDEGPFTGMVVNFFDLSLKEEGKLSFGYNVVSFPPGIDNFEERVHSGELKEEMDEAVCELMDSIIDQMVKAEETDEPQ